MAIDPHDWLEESAIKGTYGLNDRSLDAGAARLQMNNLGKNKLHIERAWTDGVQLCGIEGTYHWDHNASVAEGEFYRLCPKCLAELARRDKGGA